MNLKLLIFSFNFLFLHNSISTFYEKNDLSEKFVMRWNFQDLCDFVFDPIKRPEKFATSTEGVTFNPKLVKPGDLIFVRCPGKFFKKIHQKINCSYMILSHGIYTDAFKKEYLKFLEDDKIIAWFGVHPVSEAIDNKKFYPLPLGVVPRKYIRNNQEKYSKLFTELRNYSVKKKLLYMNFLISNFYKERMFLYKLFCCESFCTAVNVIKEEQKPFVEYISEVASHKFVLCPSGLGIDSWRVWETLLAGSIPIVKSSCMDVLYQDLPILIVDDWLVIDDQFLEEKYVEIVAKKYSLDKLFMHYWIDLIFSVKKKYFS